MKSTALWLPVFLMTFALSSNAFAHGEIEKVECINKEKNVTLTGLKTDALNQLNVTLKRGNEEWSFKKVSLQLEDQVQKDHVIERIQFEMKGRAQAELFIREVPEEKRSGTGQLRWAAADKSAVPLSCTVTY